MKGKNVLILFLVFCIFFVSVKETFAENNTWNGLKWGMNKKQIEKSLGENLEIDGNSSNVKYTISNFKVSGYLFTVNLHFTKGLSAIYLVSIDDDKKSSFLTIKDMLTEKYGNIYKHSKNVIDKYNFSETLEWQTDSTTITARYSEYFTKENDIITGFSVGYKPRKSKELDRL